MNISNQFHTRGPVFKKCKHFRINFARIFLYAGNTHVMKADNKTYIYIFATFFLFFYSIRDSNKVHTARVICLVVLYFSNTF